MVNQTYTKMLKYFIKLFRLLHFVEHRQLLTASNRATNSYVININLPQIFTFFAQQKFLTRHIVLFLCLSMIFLGACFRYLYLLAIPNKQEVYTVSAKNSIISSLGFFPALLVKVE